ncbi:hypothetical protein MNB_SV-4-1296 [hydrothermal vent metagenome]|uniref:Uncharacterized protein n=1 Tax=hydrothermal vent metagenome TaxID=652676 RepID=A0A1W1E8C8_9ZZZZ
MTQAQIREMMEKAYRELEENRGKLRKTRMSQKEQDLYGAIYLNERKGK